MATKFLRVSLKGTLGGNEQWSVNPIFALPGPQGDDLSFEAVLERAQAVAGIAPDGGLSGIWSPAAVLRTVQVEARDETGELRMTAEAAMTVQAAGGGTLKAPPQSAWVSSLRTNVPGASGRGRLYWPCLSPTLDATTLRFSTALQTTVVTGVASYLTQIQDAINISELPVIGTFGLSVWSRARNEFYPVTRVLGGSVVDTQRRRRDDLAESYVGVNWPT